MNKTQKEPKKAKQGSLGDHQEFTQREWYALGWVMFGTADQAKWRWICPSCRGIQTIKDFLDSKQEAHLVYQQCVKRKAANARDVQALPKGMCDWAAFGFFAGPWFVKTKEDGGKEGKTAIFAFAGATDEQIAKARAEVDTLIPLIKADQERLEAEDKINADGSPTAPEPEPKPESAAGFVVGDKVGYKSVIDDKEYQHVGKVRSVHPDGIPSCKEPMLMIEGKGGVVLASHCTLIERGLDNGPLTP